MKVVAIVQARTSSTRLPGKVLLPIEGKPMLIHQLERISRCKDLDSLVVATSNEATDDELASVLRKRGFDVYRGSLNDVLERYYDCALKYSADIIVRLTGDCPLSDPYLITEVIKYFRSGHWDYVSNASNDSHVSVPDGLDVEVFSIRALEIAFHQATQKSDREHVTSWFFSEQCRLTWTFYSHSPVRPYYRLTVDDSRDLELIQKIYGKLYAANNQFSLDEIISYLEENPDIASSNLDTIRNEGYRKSLSADVQVKPHTPDSAGPTLYKQAKKLIPGGNMLLSKRPEMFLPGNWPSYFSRAKGCRVWDLESREFIDMSIMGIGTNILGYGDPEVDAAVLSVVSSGNMSSLNCPEEVYLAEKLVDMHPWSDMCRFARSGGEANAIAIRIARAATGRDAVAICGYHGWHDWYLSTNLASGNNLNQHLLPGLSPSGVPSQLKGTTLPFEYNNIDQLREIVSSTKLAAIKMEVQRSMSPDPDFLSQVRQICNDNGIVLIFDECTSGFRETYGGLHLKYGVDPDIAMFGKALGNGYAITAVLGTSSVMDAAQSTFISSTFWTERIGPSAALKTLEVMQRTESYKQISKSGERLKKEWQSLADRHGIDIDLYGISALPGFTFNHPDALKFKTLLTQEMLKLGYLATTTCYMSVAHTDEIINNYLSCLDTIFQQLSTCINERSCVDDLLEGPVCHSGFSRLN